MLVLFLGLIGLSGNAAELETSPLFGWPPEGLPPGLVPHDAEVTRLDEPGLGPTLAVTFAPGDWPNLWFVPPSETPWDWRDAAGLGFRIRNDAPDAVIAAIRVDNAGADGARNCLNHRAVLPPGETTTLEAYFPSPGTAALWGMRGLPLHLPLFGGKPLDMGAITACQIFLPGNTTERRLTISSVYLIRTPASGPSPLEVTFPFVDRFGQYRHADWPGKLSNAEELQQRDRLESASADAAEPRPAERYGGWLDGPQLEGTGWFRTTKHGGKWWLVTPGGRLFLSVGVTCVGTWEQTFVEQREHWFAWLPQPDDALFGSIMTHWSGAHSGAEAIGGAGRAFSFYRANLARTFGADWPDRWRLRTLKRLESWGFNTLGNWSQSDVLAEHRLPYVVGAAIADAPVIEGAPGYWRGMLDVYDDAFVPAVERAVAAATRPHRDNPLCIGYFVDNELAWEGVLEGVLRASATQPARRALIAQLQQDHPDLAALNAAWGTNFADWAGVRAPEAPSAASETDLHKFLYRFAQHYFVTVRDALGRHAPNQLYLGCRFASAPGPVVRACAETAHVVSFNQYVPAIECAHWREKHPHNVPMLIGEFHFGALDRGMFHGGLVPVADQNARAAAYRRYWEALAACPVFVGAHWFQYADEPLTGRTFDGENYNIGLVDVTDTPYPELTAAAREVHDRIYQLRLESPPGGFATPAGLD
jgi:hypothetical protein